MPPLNQSQPAARTTCNQQDDTLSKKPAPKTVQYQPPSFNLDRPAMHLTMEERRQVHYTYISAISNLKHKKDFINRLKRIDPHNIPAYEAEMTRHMTLHEDVLGRILTILKQDDYFRTLEELPVIDSLTTYNDVQLFLKLYGTTTIIERITGEADLIERKFTTLWTMDTHRFNQHYQHTISTYTTTVGCASTTCYITVAQFR